MKRRRWTKQRVIEAIQARNAEGLPMTGVRNTDSGLCSAAYKHFGNWRNAVIAAGLKEKLRRTWDRATVIRLLQARYQSGKSMTSAWKDDWTLVSAGQRYFGDWGKALQAAGIDPPQHKSWTKTKVVAAIRERQQKGLSLTSVWQDDRLLYRGAICRYGTWNDALAAAGIQFERTKWSKPLILAELNAWRRDHPDSTSIVRDNRRLAVAARKYFGSLEKAFAEAGIESKHRKWSPERVIECIQDAYIKRVPLSSGRQDAKLVSAATRFFGSWHDALVAASVLRRDVQTQLKQRWTKERVIKAVRERHDSEHDGSVWQEDRRLTSVANRYFGGWHSALRAAGLKPQYQKWTKDKIVKCIRDLHRRRQGLKHIWNEDGPLACAAKHHFGGWHDALIAAGVMKEAERPAPRKKWCTQRVIDEIRSRKQQGHSLSSVAPCNRQLVLAAKRYFENWSNALAAAQVTSENQRQG
ncbi:MAG: hypothetical protein CML07_04495 [Psychrobacter sp.]|nr:hypothetical protein [Psychrobacter sp.]